MLTKEQILAASALKTETVKVPEWGGEVLVSEMSATDRDAWESKLLVDGKPNLLNLRARMAAFCVVGTDGKRLFSESDVEALGRKSASALDRIVRVATRLNRMTEADIEVAQKN